MKISQLIRLLEKQKQTHGDIDISLFGKVYSKNELTVIKSWNPKLGDYIAIEETN